MKRSYNIMNKDEVIYNVQLCEVVYKDQKDILVIDLMTNNIEKASQSHLIYAVMLNPQGRFLYDFFICKPKQYYSCIRYV